MLILGHRGCILKDQPYQNSLEAFKLANKLVDGIECDACLTADNDVVFIHEEVTISSKGKPLSSLPLYLDETSTQKLNNRTLQEIDSDEVRTFRLKDGSNIPFFEDVAKLFHHNTKTWNIELKGHGVTPFVIEKLEHQFKNGLIQPEQVVLSSFDHVALHEVAQKLPMVKIGAIFTAKVDVPKPLNPWRNDAEGFYFPLTAENLQRDTVQKLKPHFIIAPHTELNDAQMKLIQQHFKNSQLIVWVCGEYNNFSSVEFDKKLTKFANNQTLATIIVDDIVKRQKWNPTTFMT